MKSEYFILFPNDILAKFWRHRVKTEKHDVTKSS